MWSKLQQQKSDDGELGMPWERFRTDAVEGRDVISYPSGIQ
ncbi:hypothetical protein [Synechococcus sp. BIOS-U3-1]|nr:hypothetical protein [Synechococcus sp. BIOS-U3-1]